MNNFLVLQFHPQVSSPVLNLDVILIIILAKSVLELRYHYALRDVVSVFIYPLSFTYR